MDFSLNILQRKQGKNVSGLYYRHVRERPEQKVAGLYIRYVTKRPEHQVSQLALHYQKWHVKAIIMVALPD